MASYDLTDPSIRTSLSAGMASEFQTPDGTDQYQNIVLSAWYISRTDWSRCRWWTSIISDRRLDYQCCALRLVLPVRLDRRCNSQLGRPQVDHGVRCHWLPLVCGRTMVFRPSRPRLVPISRWRSARRNGGMSLDCRRLRSICVCTRG